MAGKKAKRTGQITIPRSERIARGQSELRARLDAELTDQLAAVLDASGETQGGWARRKIAEDFASLKT